VAALDQLAGGEWFEIRERLHRPEQLFEHLCTADRSPKSVQRLAAVLAALASSLDGAIENGVYEVRRRESWRRRSFPARSSDGWRSLSTA